MNPDLSGRSNLQSPFIKGGKGDSVKKVGYTVGYQFPSPLMGEG